MRKKLIQALILGMFFYACSMPNQIEIKGTVNLPFKIGSSNLGAAFAKILEDAFSDGLEEVYEVDYGQDFQTFCIYIPIKITESLNPKDHLETDKEEGQSPQIDEAIQIPAFDNLTFSIPVSYTLPLPLGTNDPISLSDIPIPAMSFPLDNMDAGFLHALIGTGSLSIELDLSEGDIILDKNTTATTYKITIKQSDDNSSVGNPYNGLSISTTPPADSLEGKHINKESVSVSGTIDVVSTVAAVTAGAQELKGRLIINMNINHLDKVDWDFRDISANVQNASIPLANSTQYINSLEYDECDGTTNTGIGLNFNFTEIIDGLALTVECGKLDIEDTPKPIIPGDNIFGNQKNPVTLILADTQFLDFNVTLQPDDNSGVLHLNDLTPGEALRIKGEAVFFQNWAKAVINMTETMRAKKNDGDFHGQYPDPNREEKTIDLSLMQDYFEGFEFQEIDSSIYLSGPNQVIQSIEKRGNNLSLQLAAQYTGDNDTPFIIYPKGRMNMESKRIILKDNSDYINEKGTYKQENLPNGGHHTEFSEVMNAHPDNVIFTYTVAEMPDTVTVTPEMFTDDENNNLFATIIIMLPLKMIAKENGGKIKFPDMFKGQKDLFDRKSADDDSLFTSMDVDYIRFSVDFIDAIFQNGFLFIEKEDEELLFPAGIKVDDKKLALNIEDENIEIIRNNLIPPDFRINFDPYATVAIPKNMGLTNIKFEVKGKFELEL